MATYCECETLGNSKKIFGFFTGSKMRASFLSERVVAVWNSLPEEVVTAPSVSRFKARLDAHWKNLPSICEYISLQFAIPSKQQWWVVSRWGGGGDVRDSQQDWVRKHF